MLDYPWFDPFLFVNSVFLSPPSATVGLIFTLCVCTPTLSPRSTRARPNAATMQHPSGSSRARQCDTNKLRRSVFDFKKGGAASVVWFSAWNSLHSRQRCIVNYYYWVSDRPYQYPCLLPPSSSPPSWRFPSSTIYRAPDLSYTIHPSNFSILTCFHANYTVIRSELFSL